MVYKRGDISLNFIIIAILALIALIVIALFFTGGIAKLFGTEKEVAELTLTPQMEALAKTQCELYCVNKDRDSYDSPRFSDALIEAGYSDCEGLLKESFDVRCVTEKKCQKEDPASSAICIGTKEASCERVAGCIWK